MRHNKSLLTSLILFLILFSCATAPEETSESDAETQDGVSLSDESLAGIQGAGAEQAESAVDADTVLEPEPDAFSERPEVLSDTDAVPEAEEESQESEVPEAFVKEVRRGGRKESAQEAEAFPSDPEEFLPVETAEETSLEEFAGPPVEGLATTPDERTIEESVEEPVGESVFQEAESPAEKPEEPSEGSRIAAANEDEYSVTVVNELSMGDAPSDLPSERDEIQYNPLLPLVVDAPPAASDPEESDPPRSGQSGSAHAGVESSDGPGRQAASEALGAEQIEISNDDTSDKGIREDEVAEVDAAELDSLSVDSSGKLIIELQGSGWIYMGAEGGEDFSLKDKSYNPDKRTTRFVFTTSASPGREGRLVFLKQDLLRGESSRKGLRFEMPRSPLSDREEGAPSGEVAPVRTGVEPSETDGVAGAEEAAEFVAPEVMDEQAISEPAAGSAVAGDVPEDAASLLKLAERYEAPGPDQSLEKALELYDRIKREFPVTEERFIAETRIRYLNKHYFKVQ